MKSILYVGASLMIGASIYGFVDYRQNHNKKEFTGMYRENEHQPVKNDAPVVEAKVTEPAPPVKSAGTIEKKKESGKQVAGEAVPVVKPVSEEEKLPSNEKNLEPGKTEVTAKPEVSVKKKNKKIRREIFSRAPLRYEDEDVEEDPLKAEEPARVDKTKS